MGTPEFAVPSLEILLEHEYRILAVVTAPDKPRGRGQHVSPSPVKEAALRHHLPLLQPVSLRDAALAAQLQSLRPDLIVVVAFRILPREIFSLARHGAFNLHASLLPRYRGAAPINWAIIKGEKETGVTTFLLQERVDTGRLLLQARIPIREEDDAGTIHDRLAEVGAEVVLHTVRLIEQKKAIPRPQDEHLASPAPKIFKEDCRISWALPAREIHNLVRGLSPYPAAFTSHGNRVLKVFKTSVTEVLREGDPGRVVVTPDSLHVATGDYQLAINELQQEGKKRMGVKEFVRGYRIATGDMLT
jgi:methionyl-tRNA formyltransferase